MLALALVLGLVVAPLGAAPALAGLTMRASPAWADSTHPVPAWGNLIVYLPRPSADGGFVAFQSFASNLISRDKNKGRDVFLLDRTDQTITAVSVASSGVLGGGSSFMGDISADGGVVVFSSTAANLDPADTEIGDAVSINGPSRLPAVSADGRIVAF
jgi:hypothetical protein